MNKSLTILILALLSTPLFAQTYQGNIKIKDIQYSCMFRINADSTINFVCNREGNFVYMEYNGKIRQMKDTLYHVSAEIVFAQAPSKSVYYKEPILVVSLDKTITGLDKLTVRYSDGSTKDFPCNAGETLEIPRNEKLFNKKRGRSNYFVFSIDRKNPITGKTLQFEIDDISEAGFYKGDKTDFEVIIKNNDFYSTEQSSEKIGFFKLKKDKIR